MVLSEHFALDEFVRSQTASRKGIDNTPPPEVIRRLRLLCLNVLEPLRDRVGPISILSGYRCKALNDAVGSKDTSQHLLGEAADIDAIHMDETRLMAEIVGSDLPYDQVIREFPPGGWVHISHNPERAPRRAALLIDGRGTRQWSV